MEIMQNYLKMAVKCLIIAVQNPQEEKEKIPEKFWEGLNIK